MPSCKFSTHLPNVSSSHVQSLSLSLCISWDDQCSSGLSEKHFCIIGKGPFTGVSSCQHNRNVTISSGCG